MTECSVIIVNWNHKHILSQCLESLPAGMEGLRHEVWVVDNASTDGSADMVANEFPWAHLIRNKENVGFAKANNQALAHATGRYILLLNSDSMLLPRSMKGLYDFMESHQHIGMVGPRLMRPDSTLQPSTYPLPTLATEVFRTLRLSSVVPGKYSGALLLGTFWDHRQTRPVGRLSGACIVVRHDTIRDVGLLDEEFHFYGEVHDWCWQMWKAGWEVWFCHTIEAFHLGGQSAQTRWGVLEKRRRVLESTHRLLKKHTSRLFMWAWYLLQLTSTSLSLGQRLLLPTGPQTRDTALLRADWWWYFARLGYRLLKDTIQPAFWRVPLLQAPLLASLRSVWATPTATLRRYWKEALAAEGDLRRRWPTEHGYCVNTGMLELSAGRFLYILVRAVRPTVIVETGVANGASSTFILAALTANGHGELYSLDLPITPDGKTFLPRAKPVGWLVPESLRSRWHLTLGDVRQTLPPLLTTLGHVDLFFHDSDHSYETMTYEYSQAWQCLSARGWLLSDDINANAAFEEFTQSQHCRAWIWAGRLGIALKS